MAEETQEWKPKSNPWLIAASVMLATFMEVLDTSIAAVALPYIAGSLSATNDEAVWVLTSYLVANAVVLPTSAWASLRFGRKRFLLVCIVIFTAASFACGSANSLAFILAARAIQGAGGGALQPLSQAIILESFPPKMRGMGTAIFALGVVVAPILGPTLGGYLTDTHSWRWAFYINIPIGILAIIMISIFVEDPPYIKSAKPGPLDGIGLGLLIVALGSMQVILDKGQEDDWFGSSLIRFLFVTMVLGFGAFIWFELRKKSPLVQLSIFRNKNFSVGCILIFLFGAAIYGTVTILPLFYQQLLGYTATVAGFAVAPRGIGAVLAMPVVGILVGRLDNRYLVATGFITFGLCSLWLSWLNLELAQYTLFWPIVISGAALGFVFVPLSTSSLGDLPPAQVGNASGLFNLMRNVGGSVGISIVNTIATRHGQTHRNEILRNVTPYDVPFRAQLDSLTQSMSQFVDPVTAMRRAYFMINRTLDQQAMLWAFVDDFRYMALVCLLCAPVCFLLKKVESKGGISAE